MKKQGIEGKQEKRKARKIVGKSGEIKVCVVEKEARNIGKKREI